MGWRNDADYFGAQGCDSVGLHQQGEGIAGRYSKERGDNLAAIAPVTGLLIPCQRFNPDTDRVARRIRALSARGRCQSFSQRSGVPLCWASAIARNILHVRMALSAKETPNPIPTQLGS